MSVEVLENVSQPEAARAAARSRAYATFAEAFEYPDAELYEAVRSGAFSRALRDVLAAVHPSLVDDLDAAALSEAGEADDLAVEFTRLFDVGASGPPCPLYGGLYIGARMKTMEEAVRFYNHFGLTLSDGSEAPRELPDHITTQLEFLHFLAFREAEALDAGGEADDYRRAQRDFIARHPGRWVPKLLTKLETQEPMAFFRELVLRLARLLAHDLEQLVAQVGPVPTGRPGGLGEASSSS
jgi:DMSO reductase family type II enzyme chaperone